MGNVKSVTDDVSNQRLLCMDETLVSASHELDELKSRFAEMEIALSDLASAFSEQEKRLSANDELIYTLQKENHWTFEDICQHHKCTKEQIPKDAQDKMSAYWNATIGGIPTKDYLKSLKSQKRKD